MNNFTGGYSTYPDSISLARHTFGGNAGIIPEINGVYLMMDDRTGKSKPVIVVSNAEYNKGPFCYICPLTIDEKPQTPTIFKTWATGSESNAVMDNLRSIDKTRLVQYIGELSSVEAQAKNDAICNLFGINTLDLPEPLKDLGLSESAKISPNSSSTADTSRDKYVEDLKYQLRTERQRADDLQKEVEFYKQQYDSLLNKLISNKAV